MSALTAYSAEAVVAKFIDSAHADIVEAAAIKSASDLFVEAAIYAAQSVALGLSATAIAKAGKAAKAADKATLTGRIDTQAKYVMQTVRAGRIYALDGQTLALPENCPVKHVRTLVAKLSTLTEKGGDSVDSITAMSTSSAEAIRAIVKAIRVLKTLARETVAAKKLADEAAALKAAGIEADEAADEADEADEATATVSGARTYVEIMRDARDLLVSLVGVEVFEAADSDEILAIGQEIASLVNWTADVKVAA